MDKSVSTGPARMTPLRELQLLEQHKSGDPKALGELLTSFQRRMYTICNRMLGSVEDASDATQDALLKVISGLDSYTGKAKFSTWVYRITLNTCYDRMRADKKHRHAPISAAIQEAENEANSPSEARHREPSGLVHVQQHEAREHLQRALGMLDKDSRAVLVLRDVQDLDYQQVADVLEVPVGTVKSRLYRARNELRGILEREAAQDEASARASEGKSKSA